MVCLLLSNIKKPLKKSTEVGAAAEAEAQTAKLHVAAALCALYPPNPAFNSNSSAKLFPRWSVPNPTLSQSGRHCHSMLEFQ
jgi:hypothetical protein